MTHKEKADELVERFYDPIEDFDLKNDYPEPKKRKECAIQCAIICVEEIIEESKSLVFNYGLDDTFKTNSPAHTSIPYWQSVINELKAML